MNEKQTDRDREGSETEGLKDDLTNSDLVMMNRWESRDKVLDQKLGNVNDLLKEVQEVSV